MSEKTLMKIGRISLVKTDYECFPDEVAFIFTNKATDYQSRDEEVEEEITRDDAERLIEHNKMMLEKEAKQNK